MRKNQMAELTITGYTAEGNGVGRLDGMAVFVPGAAAGDRLRVKIVKAEKSFAFAKIEEILSPSPDRVEEDCVQAVRCGGCVFRHISYEAELAAKERRVYDALTRIGGLCDPPINPIVSSECAARYRNKAQIPVGKGEDGELLLGYYAPRSHRIVDCGGCLLQPEIFEEALRIFRAWAEEHHPEPYDELIHRGKLRHIYLRLAQKTGELMFCLVVNGNGLKGEEELARRLKEELPGLKSVIINSNREKTNVILGPKCRTVWGSDFITDELCGLKFHLSPLSFYQVNRSQAERLYTLVADCAALKKEDILLDLYCGTGTIGLSMASRVKRVIGVEIIPQAVEDAKKNAALNEINNAEFYCADAAEAAERLRKEGVSPNVIVLDPPRKGISPELVKTVCGFSPERAVYVSCDPATLSRDLKLFGAEGYSVKDVTPVDMFPRTAHVETVALLSRAGS